MTQCRTIPLFAFASAALLSSSTFAAEFTQKQCLGIAEAAGEVVKTVGKDNLSTEFRQSFRDWLGADMQCNGPKDIIIVTHQDPVTYGTIRGVLLSGSKPISLQKAGLRPVVREKLVP